MQILTRGFTLSIFSSILQRRANVRNIKTISRVITTAINFHNSLLYPKMFFSFHSMWPPFRPRKSTDMAEFVLPKHVSNTLVSRHKYRSRCCIMIWWDYTKANVSHSSFQVDQALCLTYRKLLWVLGKNFPAMLALRSKRHQHSIAHVLQRRFYICTRLR